MQFGTWSKRSALVVAALLAVSVAAWAEVQFEFPNDWFFHRTDEQRAKHAELLGKPMPPLQVDSWLNGEVKPEDMKGKVVVLDFWATWCGPCIASIPHNNELARKYASQGVVFIGVCTNKRGLEKYEQTVKDKGMEYHSAKDSELATEKAYGVMWYPTYAVVDRKGNLRAIGLKPGKVEDVVKKLLEEDATASAGQ